MHRKHFIVYWSLLFYCTTFLLTKRWIQSIDLDLWTTPWTSLAYLSSTSACQRFFLYFNKLLWQKETVQHLSKWCHTVWVHRRRLLRTVVVGVILYLLIQVHKFRISTLRFECNVMKFWLTPIFTVTMFFQLWYFIKM